jgi:hypothetical protein
LENIAGLSSLIPALKLAEATAGIAIAAMAPAQASAVKNFVSRIGMVDVRLLGNWFAGLLPGSPVTV